MPNVRSSPRSEKEKKTRLDCQQEERGYASHNPKRKSRWKAAFYDSTLSTAERPNSHFGQFLESRVMLARIVKRNPVASIEKLQRRCSLQWLFLCWCRACNWLILHGGSEEESSFVYSLHGCHRSIAGVISFPMPNCESCFALFRREVKQSRAKI